MLSAPYALEKKGHLLFRVTTQDMEVESERRKEKQKEKSRQTIPFSVPSSAMREPFSS